VICSACHLTRDASDLIAFWPIGRPEARRFVCRPTCPSARMPGPCFGQIVGPASLHRIELVVPSSDLATATAHAPVLPNTAAWRALMASAGVRSIAA